MKKKIGVIGNSLTKQSLDMFEKSDEDISKMIQEVDSELEDAERLLQQLNKNIDIHSQMMIDMKYSHLTRKEQNQELEPVRTEPKIGRNEPCPCGSGKKNKKCCNK